MASASPYKQSSSSRMMTSRITSQADTIDVANVSDDVYFDRRNLRDSLNNGNGSSSSYRTSSASSRNPSTEKITSNGNKGMVRNNNSSSETSCRQFSGSSPSSSNINNDSTRSQLSRNKMMRQDHTITIDVPTFRDRNEIVVRTSDNTVELRAQNTNTSFYRKPSCDNSHLDWYGTDNEEGSSANSHVQNNEETSESRLINKKHNGAIIVQENTVNKGSSRRNNWSFESVWGGSSDTDEENPHLSSNGSFRSHGRMLLSCISALIVLSASIGVLVLIIPFWMRSEERGESGEVGGLSYGEGDGVLLDNSNIDGVVLPAAASSVVVLEPPPYNLNIICKQQSLLEEGGYDRCVSACLPSRCCLLDESEQYEVWTTLHIGSNNARDDKEIGKFISSCFNENENICIRYNQGCSILGKHVLLPVKPPLDTAVMIMNNSQKLQLAETIIRACSSTSEGANGEGLGECQAFCEAKECCFLKDTNEDEAIVDSGSITSENNGRNTQQTDYCGDDPQSFCLLYAGCEQYLQEHRNNGERKE